MAGNFEKNSIDWQWQLLQMRIGEWWDRIFQSPPGQDFRPPDWSFLEGFVRLGFWLIAIALVLWVGWQLYSFLRPYLGSRRGQAISQTSGKQTFTQHLTVAQWLQRSRDFAQRGNYREACRTLYQAALQRLDEQGAIPQQMSRTDGEYLRMVQTLPNPRPYQVLLRTHEQLCFDTSEISAETFAACERAYRELETA